MSGARIWLSKAWKMPFSLIGGAKIWLSEAWNMRHFFRKVGVHRWAVRKSSFPKLEKCNISRDKWGWTDGRCRNQAFQSVENAIFLEKSGGGQMGGAGIWLSKA